MVSKTQEQSLLYSKLLGVCYVFVVTTTWPIAKISMKSKLSFVLKGSKSIGLAMAHLAHLSKLALHISVHKYMHIISHIN